MAINGPGDPGYVQSSYDTTSQATQGDVQNTPGTATNTVDHITGNNSTSSFIANNVVCAASVQTKITSVTLAAGTWSVTANVSASVNSTLKAGDQEVALIPHGGAVGTAYAVTPLAPDSAGTEGVASLTALIVLTKQTAVDLVGNCVGSGLNSSTFTALATTASGYANATGIVAKPTV